MHSRCAKTKRVSLFLAKGFICEGCVEAVKGIVEPDEKISFYDHVNLLTSFCYLKDRLIASGRSEREQELDE